VTLGTFVHRAFFPRTMSTSDAPRRSARVAAAGAKRAAEKEATRQEAERAERKRKQDDERFANEFRKRIVKEAEAHRPDTLAIDVFSDLVYGGLPIALCEAVRCAIKTLNFAEITVSGAFSREDVDRGDLEHGLNRMRDYCDDEAVNLTTWGGTIGNPTHWRCTFKISESCGY